MLSALAVVTVVVVGLLVGVEFAVAAFVNPIFDRLPGGGGLAARADGARLLGRVMPPWYVASVALGALWAFLTWGQTGAMTITVAAALLVTSVVLSVVFLVPINSRVARWSHGDAPADWKQQVRRWDRLHYVRVVIIGAAFVLLTLVRRS